MAMRLDETSFDFEIPIPEGISSSDKKEMLDRIGDYVVKAMIDKIEEGISPIEGVGDFKRLTKHYADEEKGGNRTSNLDEHGDMLGAFEYKIKGNGLKIGIFDKEQAVKSYAHNTGFKGHPTLEGRAPKRQFIPGNGQRLDSEILSGVWDIIDEY